MYGLFASQFLSLRNEANKVNATVTVCVDKIAASGGYMIACVANKVLAAPFSRIGSVGVLAQIINFNK